MTASIAVFPEWLEGLTDRFHQAHRAVPLRPNRIFSQIETQAEISVGVSRLLHDWMLSRNADCAELLRQLTQCQRACEEMHWQVARSLRYTYVTPLDAEDLLGFSLRSLHLVEGFCNAARLLPEVGAMPGTFVPPQEGLVRCCESFADVISAFERKQPADVPLRALWDRHREAKLALRAVRTALLHEQTSPVHLMGGLTMQRQFAGLIHQFRRANHFVRSVRCKNG